MSLYPLTERMKGRLSLHLLRTPCPLMGKGLDRGARKDQITPTFVLPRQGEGLDAVAVGHLGIGRLLSGPEPTFEGWREKHEVNSPIRCPSCTSRARSKNCGCGEEMRLPKIVTPECFNRGSSPNSTWIPA